MAPTDTVARGMAWRLIAGFLAGFLATLLFHQLTLALLWRLGVAPFGPFPMGTTWPFSIPAVWSLAFWGGIWGVLFALVERRFPRKAYGPSPFSLAPCCLPWSPSWSYCRLRGSHWEVGGT